MYVSGKLRHQVTQPGGLFRHEIESAQFNVPVPVLMIPFQHLVYKPLAGGQPVLRPGKIRHLPVQKTPVARAAGIGHGIFVRDRIRYGNDYLTFVSWIPEPFRSLRNAPVDRIKALPVLKPVIYQVKPVRLECRLQITAVIRPVSRIECHPGTMVHNLQEKETIEQPMLLPVPVSICHQVFHPVNVIELRLASTRIAQDIVPGRKMLFEFFLTGSFRRLQRMLPYKFRYIFLRQHSTCDIRMIGSKLVYPQIEDLPHILRIIYCPHIHAETMLSCHLHIVRGLQQVIIICIDSIDHVVKQVINRPVTSEILDNKTGCGLCKKTALPDIERNEHNLGRVKHAVFFQFLD